MRSFACDMKRGAGGSSFHIGGDGGITPLRSVIRTLRAGEQHATQACSPRFSAQCEPSRFATAFALGAIFAIKKEPEGHLP